MTSAEQTRIEFEPGINPRETGLERFDFVGLFGNENPVVLEIGSGKGRFLIDAGRSRPESNFVGIEWSLHYYRVICRRLLHHGTSNARIVNFDAFKVLREMMPASSISEVHIYFPDPWPRPRQRKRRVVRDEVAKELVRVMKPGAHGVYVTDHEEFFEKASLVLQEFFDSEIVDTSLQSPRTNYEAKYREEGRPIYEARFTRRA